MKIVKPSVELIDEQDQIKKIELVARTCYKSEKYITDDSAITMVRSLVNNDHTAMLEHAHYVFEVSNETVDRIKQHLHYFQDKRIDYIPINITDKGRWECKRNLVSGNLRAFLNLHCVEMDMIIRHHYPELIEFFPLAYDTVNKTPREVEIMVESSKALSNDDLLNLHCLSAYEYNMHTYITFKFICDRGVSHEFVRHRVFSFAQESTRYCNYSKGKFDSECTFIEPFFFKDNHFKMSEWKSAMLVSEKMYLSLIEAGATPEEARGVLPNSLKTELVMTGNLEQWLLQFLELRYRGSTGKPHPQAKELASLVRNYTNDFKRKRNLVLEKGDYYQDVKQYL